MRDIAGDEQQSYRRKSCLLTGGADQWSALSRIKADPCPALVAGVAAAPGQ
jgi:hypothetical protein